MLIFSTHIEKLESEEIATLGVSQITIDNQIDNIIQKESKDIEASENTSDSGASVERTNIQALETEFEIKSNSDLPSEVVSTNPGHDTANVNVDVKHIDVGTEMKIDISNFDKESKECNCIEWILQRKCKIRRRTNCKYCTIYD